MSAASTTCDRFESEALLRLEAGETLDEHFDQCPDCLAARQRYRRLTDALGALGASEEAPAGWQREVRRRIAEQPEKRRGSPRLRWLAGALAAGLALVLFPLVRDSAPPAVTLTVALEVEAAADASHRSTDARPGDTLVVRATGASSEARELRVYRNEVDLLLLCPGSPGCTAGEEGLTGRLVMPTPGRYRALWVIAASPPEYRGQLEADLEAALTAGAEVELSEVVEVR